MLKSCFSSIQNQYVRITNRALSFVEEHGDGALFVLGSTLLILGLLDLASAQATLSNSEADFNDDLIRGAVGNLFLLIEGAFGALIMVVAGIGAIVAASMGAYRAAVGMLVVAVGSFILRALVSLFFGDDYDAFRNE